MAGKTNGQTTNGQIDIIHNVNTKIYLIFDKKYLETVIKGYLMPKFSDIFK